MTTFQCKSRDAAGTVNESTITADNQRAAMAQLKASGLFPISIREFHGRIAAATKTDSSQPARVRGRVKTKDVGQFTEQLASLMSAGVPILSGLTSIAQQSQSEAFGAVLKSLYADVEGGMSLSAAMAKHPAAFNEAYVNSVAAGEASGTLEKFLLNLAEFIEADLEVRSDVRTALLYPTILITTLGAAVTVLVIFVVPRFAGLYGGMSSDLPLPTLILMGTSTMVTQHFLKVVVALVVAGWLFAKYARTEAGRNTLDRLLLRVPVIGRLIGIAVTLRVMQMMELFHHAGVPVIEGLRIISRTVSNRRFRSDLDAVSESVASGESLSGAMQANDCFSPAVRQMIATGESTGSLERSYSSVAVQLKKELKYLTKNLATFIEPILTLFLACIVLFIALATFLPMWNLAQVMQK